MATAQLTVRGLDRAHPSAAIRKYTTKQDGGLQLGALFAPRAATLSQPPRPHLETQGTDRAGTPAMRMAEIKEGGLCRSWSDDPARRFLKQKSGRQAPSGWAAPGQETHAGTQGVDVGCRRDIFLYMDPIYGYAGLSATPPTTYISQ